LHLGDNTGLHDIFHGDEDIIGRMAVEGCSEPLLVKMVTNEADATTENEKTVQCANLDILISFLSSERAAITEEIDEANCDAAVDVENELWDTRQITCRLMASKNIPYLSLP